jgi:hypothetical protein
MGLCCSRSASKKLIPTVEVIRNTSSASHADRIINTETRAAVGCANIRDEFRNERIIPHDVIGKPGPRKPYL